MTVAPDESALQTDHADLRVDKSTLPVARRARFSVAKWARNPGVLLSLITLLGLGLRLISLDQPALWGDEAFTYSRICGTFRQLLDVLQFDGFMPLHYVIYWWLDKQVDLSPFWMRLPVALAGAAMPPVMYFLCRQMGISIRTALVTALFAACSAYMLTYSRDAKMYMPFWLFCTLHVACLLWWLNGRVPAAVDMDADSTEPRWRRWMRSGVVRPALEVPTSPGTFRWLCWLTSGAMMIGYHQLGLMIVAVQGLLFATHRNVHWRPAVGFLVGLALMIGLRQIHITQFSDWDNRVEESWSRSGVQWVNLYNAERTGVDLAKFAGTAFLMSWEWPVKSWQPRIDARVLKVLMTVSVAFALLTALGLAWMALCHVIEHSRATGVNPCDPTERASSTVRTWQKILWLAGWLLLPAYAIYAKSIPLGKVPFNEKTGTHFAAPWGDAVAFPASTAEWMNLLQATAGLALLPASLAVIGLLTAAGVLVVWRYRRDRWPGALLSIVLPVLGLFAGLCLLYIVLRQMAIADTAAGKEWHSVWMPRYLGALWPAFAIILCAALMSLPTRALRIGAVGLLLAVNLTQFAVRVWAGSEPPSDKMARDIAAGQPIHVRAMQVGRDLSLANFYLGTGLASPRFDRALDHMNRLPVEPSTTRTYMQTGVWSPEPGGGVLGSYAMRYYLCHYIGVDADPPSFRRRTALIDRQWVVQSGTSPRLIAGDAAKFPATNRIITWDRYDRPQRDAARNDPIVTALGKGWRKTSDQTVQVRDHWTWLNKYQLRRREFVRDHAAPVTQPALQPSTKPATRPTTGP